MQKTNFPFEILIGEDESNDGTRRICQEYARKHPKKIRLFLRHRRDVIHIGGRPTGRFNFLATLREAKGRYIALCEGDDFWTDPDKLQIQVDSLEKCPGAAISFHETVALYPDGHTGSICGFPDEVQFEQQDLLLENFVPTTSVLFRRPADWSELDEIGNSPVGDWPMHAIIACANYQIIDTS